MEVLAEELDFDLILNPLSKITENLVSLAIGLFHYPEKILIINGDILIGESAIKRIMSKEGNILMVERWKGTEATDDTLFYHDYDKEAMKIEYDGEKVTNVSKNIGRWETWGEYIGLAKIENVEVLYKAVMDLIKSSQVHAWYEEAFNWMIKNGITFNLSYVEPTDFWFEIDTMEDLEKAEKIYND